MENDCIDLSFANGVCSLCIGGVGALCDDCTQSFGSSGPEKYTGEYECQKYGANMNSWHYVTITHEGENEYKWTNSAGVSWSLY